MLKLFIFAACLFISTQNVFSATEEKNKINDNSPLGWSEFVHSEKTQQSLKRIKERKPFIERMVKIAQGLNDIQIQKIELQKKQEILESEFKQLGLDIKKYEQENGIESDS